MNILAVRYGYDNNNTIFNRYTPTGHLNNIKHLKKKKKPKRYFIKIRVENKKNTKTWKGTRNF